MTKIFFGSLVMMMFVMAVGLISRAEADGYNSWTEVAEAMEVSLNNAYDSCLKGELKEGRDWVNDAYFGFYEKEGFERNVKSRISGKRASVVEYKFATIKKSILDGAEVGTVRTEIDTLIAWLKEDAANLDGLSTQATSVQDSEPVATGVEAGSENKDAQGKGWGMFFAALGILLREGFEAILVIAAIAAYLARAGLESKVATVYKSSVAAVAASVVAAIVFTKLMNISGANQEIMEGGTMILATVVLFFVSNWMFSKAEAEAWKNYISGKVKAAMSSGSTFALAAAAFLAVFREGAETILFYQGILIEAGEESQMVWYGFALGCVGLAIIFVIIRHGTLKLPLKPFFIGTSILMYIMSISFVGGGIKEFQEGDLVGVTLVPGIPTIDILGIYPTVQTLLPQLVLLILAVLSILYYRKQARSLKSETV